MSHHHSPDNPPEEGKGLSQEKRKSVFDFQIGGFPWTLVLLVVVMLVALAVVVFKAMGVF